MKKVLPVGMIIFDAVLFLFYFLLDGALSFVGKLFSWLPMVGSGIEKLFAFIGKMAIIPACILLVIIIIMIVIRIVRNRKLKNSACSTVNSINQAQPVNTVSVNGTSSMKTNTSASSGNKMEVF